MRRLRFGQWLVRHAGRPEPAVAVDGWPGETFRISEDLAANLREILVLDPDCERAVYRARVDRGRIILSATDDELDELLGYLAAEANHESNRRRRHRLDAAYDELGSAASVPVKPPTTAPDGASATHRGPRAATTPPTAATPAAPPTGPPALDVARVQRWCVARVPDRARHQVRVECEAAARHLTIVERRAPWQEGTGQDWTSFPIARLRYAKAAQLWTLYWRDRNLRFHLYDRLPPSRHVDDLLAEIDRDPTGIFWG